MAAGTRLCGAPKPSLTTTSKPATLTPQARRTFQESFDSFEKTVQRYSRTDDREFRNTELRDVRDAAKQVERQLAARQCMRNMKRLEPFLNGLEAYSKVIEVLCNGTPFLSWIWAPIKLMMQLATDHIGAFEKLLAAYSQIAAMLPRFDRLGIALQDKPDFQQALAVVYSDILTFHEHAYKLFRRNGWICFFKSSWGQFGSRFNCILDSLAKHATLIDQEANAYLVSETMLWRREALQVVEKTEKDRSTAQLIAALSWLGLEAVPHCGQAYQDNLLDKLIKDCCDGTTDWILKHQRMRQWLQNGRGGPILWLKGKPGSGKSTLCAKIVHFLRASRQSTVLFCFYSYIVSSTYPDPVVFILATLVSQILRQRTDLATYVYEEFVAESRPLSIRNLQELLSDILPQLVMPRILIDGIDECIRYDVHGKPSDLTPVKDVLASILQLESPTQARAPTKILVVSRDILEVVGKLSKRPTVALDQESDALTADITRFATKRLETIRERFESLHGVDDILQEVKKDVVSRSRGMFLWVRLVLLQLEDDADNLDDLENAVANMPHSLHDFYARIVHRIMLYSPQSRERTINILKWMLCSRRPLRVAELQDAVVFASGAVSLSERSKLPASIVDRCRPLVQTDDNEQISFVHFTVQEYLTKSGFISLRDAERCTIITCLNYLTFSLDLSNPNTSARRKAVGVGRCLYILQPYVHEHWLDHLLAFAAEVTQTRDRQLEACLEILLSIYSHRYALYLDQANKVQPDILAARNLEPRLRFLEHYGDYYEFLCVYVNYRHTKQVHFEMPDDNSEPLDPTPLTVVQLEYAKRVEFLLSADAVPGLTPEELTMFKSTNCPYAFVCRFPGCSGMLAGFPTHDLRAQHEKTHKPTLFCTHSGCTYKLPFASQQSLGRHIRTFHNSVPRSAPKSIRRRQAMRSKDRDDYAGIPNAPGGRVLSSFLNATASRPEPELKAVTSDVQNATMTRVLDGSLGPTGQRSHASRWATELDLEAVIKESLKTAEEEKLEAPGSPPSRRDLRSPPLRGDQRQWMSGYPTPQRQAPSSSNLYNVMSNPRGSPNGNATHYTYMGPEAGSQYPSQGYPPTNGVNNSGKRDRDDEEVELLNANASPPLVATIEGEEESSTIKCICGYSDDDGNTVLCEKCDTWQHIVCYYESAQHVPDVHECADCLPRAMDLRSASEKQRLRREVHSIGERKGLYKASTKNPKKRTKDTHVPPPQQQDYSATHPYTSPIHYEQREEQPQNNGERSSDPQPGPRRQYRSSDAPGTQFRSYQRPSSYEHYRRADGKMKKYPPGNEYFSNPSAETQQLHDSSNRTRTQSATARTTTDDEFGYYMKAMADLSKEYDNAVRNDKAAENRLMPNDSITRPPPKFPDARPKFLEVPGLPTSRRDMGSPPSWGTQYNSVNNQLSDPYDLFANDSDNPDLSRVPLAKEPLPRMPQLSDGNRHRPRDAPKRFLSEDLHSMVAPSDPASRGDVFLRASGGSFF